MSFHLINPAVLEFLCEFLVPFLPAIIILATYTISLRIAQSL